MARSVVDIELPRLRRDCSRHKFCAYTGRERNRCPICHSTYIEDVCQHLTLPPGRTRPCFCDCCGELFTSVSAFDQHQRPAGVCRDPARRGLILVDHGGWAMWGKPGSRPEDL